MYETTYHRPSSVDEAAAMFAKGSESKYLAGGHTLIPVMKQRLSSPSDVIDLAKIKDLIGIEPTDAGIMIKAATTHYDVANSGAVQKTIPALAHLASLIGDPAVRYRGTIGGSLANNDPAADYPAAVVAKTKSGEVRVAVTGVSQSGVMRVPTIEAALKADWSAAALDKVAISTDGLLNDLHGSADYRAHLIKGMAKRALAV